MSYKSETSKRIFEAQTTLANKRWRSIYNEQTSVTLLAVPVNFRSAVLRITFEAVPQDYHNYQGRADKSEETVVKRPLKMLI